VVSGASSWPTTATRPDPSRLARDYERLPTTPAGLHFAAVICLLLPKLLSLIDGS
jgi:hypothetical protein